MATAPSLPAMLRNCIVLSSFLLATAVAVDFIQVDTSSRQFIDSSGN